MVKKIDFALGIGIGFVILSVISLFLNISVQVITTLSISSLFLTIAQAIQSFIEIRDKENQQKFDFFKDYGNFKIDEKTEFLVKKHLNLFTNNKKITFFKIISRIFEIASIVILLLGLSVPLKVFELQRIGNFCTLLSFALLFFNIWLVGIVKNRIELWNEIRLFNMLFKNNNPDNNEMKEYTNGQTENAQHE